MDYTDHYLEESKRLSELEQLEKAERGIVTTTSQTTAHYGISGVSGTSGMAGTSGIFGEVNPDVSYVIKDGVWIKHYKGIPHVDR